MNSETLQPRLLGHGVLTLVLLTLVSSEAHSDIWYVEPNASIRAFYDDNVRLSTRDPESSSGAIVRGRVTAGRRTEISDIGLGLTINSKQYTDVSELDRTNGALDLNSSYQLERHRFGLGANLDYDSTLTSEEATSGFVQVNKRRSRFAVRPSWTYQMTERATLDTGVSYEDVSYEDVGNIPLSNYSFTRASATLGYQLSERLQLVGQTAYDSYESTAAGTRSTSLGVEAGLRYLLSETSSVRALAGVRHSNAETPTEEGVDDTDNVGPIFQLEWTKDFIVGGIELVAERSLLPSGRGTLLDTTGITLGFDYPISPLWTFGLNASAYRNRNPGGEISGNDREYIDLAPRLGRRLSESLSLDMSYRLRWQKREISDEDALSNAVFLSLNYRWPREPLRRFSTLR